jgi:hypothetical protein
MKPSFFSLRGLMTTGFLRDLIYLEPLNLFLYAWRFLRELEEEEENKTFKMCFRGFSLVSIVLLPLAFYCIVPTYIVENSRWYYYAFHVQPRMEQHYYFIELALWKTINILGPVTNLISCLILVLVIRHIYKLSKQVDVGKDAVSAKSKVNRFVTVSHIVVTLAFTVTQSILPLTYNIVPSDRMHTAFLFFGGLADIFLSVMLWFILDTDKAVAVVVHGNKVYAVTDVIKASFSSINEYSMEDEEKE